MKLSSPDCVMRSATANKLQDNCTIAEHGAVMEFVLMANEGNEQYYVEILFNGSPIKICGEDKCEFSKFVETITQLMSVDRFKECYNFESIYPTDVSEDL